MKAKQQFLFAAQAALFTATTLSGELVVYEGFDYTLGENIWAQDGGTGWMGSWAGTETDSNNGSRGLPVVGEGLSFGSLAVTGGAYVRPQRYGSAESSRAISASAQSALTADATTIWFSVLMSGNTGGSGGGFAPNSHGAIIFSDTELTTANPGSAPPTIAEGGNGIGVSFDGVQQGTAADLGIHGISYSEGVITSAIEDKLLTGDGTVMVAGKIDWAANGSNDVLSLYQITDPALALPQPFSTIEVDLDQSTFNIVAIAQGQTEIFDEIRFGESFADVSPSDQTNPSLVSTTPANGAVDVAITDDLVATFDETINLGTTGEVTLINLGDSSEIVISLAEEEEDGELTVSGSDLIINPPVNLELGAQYAVQIDADLLLDAAGNSFAGIADTTTWVFTTDSSDIYPPSPDPMTFAIAPTATSHSEITMTSTTAEDINPVEYLFTNVTLGTDSGWQASPTYTATGLDADTPYSFTVTARDTSANFVETAASAAETAWTFPEVTGDEIIATVFAGRSISGLTATIPDFTVNGVEDPGSLTVEPIEGSSVTVNALFDTAAAQNHLAPQTNINSAHWQFDLPLVVGSEAVTLGDIELYVRSFSGSGVWKVTQQGNGLQDHYFTIELFDASLTSLGSQQIFATEGSQYDYDATFNFAKGIELSANQTYTLNVLVSGLDPAEPANAGNYVGLDAIRVLTEEASASSPFADWLSANFPGETDETIVGPNADPDGDGIDNLAEYALNSLPNDSTSQPAITVTTDDTEVSISYPTVAAATDVSYTVQWSTDLENWFTEGITETLDPDPAEDADFPVIKASLARETDDAKFMRVLIEQL
ncbi:MAG: Ig-like domain-containing protein [Verrucomicrobiota bacterium JB023]|nr:Ig-like domain-containing protein [Verrucomicrobiota bacterium JB023]